MDYLKENDVHMIINTYTPYKDYKIYYNEFKPWVNKLFDLVKKKNKIVIPIASNGMAKDLYKMILKEYSSLNVLIINRETPDNEKVLGLMNINEKWCLYDVIIYTPSVCMGVSFDTIHFDYIFGYGCHESLGAKEFCQMLHRVRTPKNKEIYLCLDKFKIYKEKEHKISYSDAEDILCNDYYLTHYNIHTNLLTKKVEIDNSSNKIKYTYPYKHEAIYEMYIYNCQENIENKLNFSACFIGYAKYKKYDIQYFEFNEDNIDMKDFTEIRKSKK